MKHFTAKEWIDFVNQVVSPSALDEMENHLKQGCKRYQETVSVWQRVQESAHYPVRFEVQFLAVVMPNRFSTADLLG